jgi:hypothetical protein
LTTGNGGVKVSIVVVLWKFEWNGRYSVYKKGQRRNMKKFIVSVGLAATGAAALQMRCVSQSSPLESPKEWNVSASLRGFYDDNYSTIPNKQGSYGVEVSPTLSASLPFTQTEFGAYYNYNLQWYQQRQEAGLNPYDQSHTFNLWVDHAFNERWQVKANNSFVVGQEPELLLAGAQGAPATPLRLNGDNIDNNGSVLVHADWTRLFSTEVTYGNNLSLYSQNASGSLTNLNAGVYSDTVTNSYAGTLNLDQNSLNLDLQWHVAPETTFTVGYQFILVNYIGDQIIAAYNRPSGLKPITFYSDSRDNLSHIVDLGLQHNFMPDLVGAVKAGIQYNETINNPLANTTALSPYVDMSLIYTYTPGCNAQIGFTEMRNATDIVSVGGNGSLTQDQQSSSLHASINHHFTPKFLTTVIGSWTASTYNGGGSNGETDNDYGLGLSANYAFTRYISGELDYNYDNLTSGIQGRSFDRNRVTLGLSVAY